MSPSRTNDLAELDASRLRHSQNILEFLERWHPIGSRICWRRGRSWPLTGVVTGHSEQNGYARVWVRNDETGKEYAIGLIDVSSGSRS